MSTVPIIFRLWEEVKHWVRSEYEHMLETKNIFGKDENYDIIYMIITATVKVICH